MFFWEIKIVILHKKEMITLGILYMLHTMYIHMGKSMILFLQDCKSENHLKGERKVWENEKCIG